MSARRLPALLASCLLLAACGDDGAKTTPTADTLAPADTAAPADATAPADTAPADTILPADTLPAIDTTPGPDTAGPADATTDTAAPTDTSTGPDFSTTCPGIIACLGACADLPVAQQQSCGTACISAGSADEKDAFLNFYTCLQTKNCLTDDTSDASLRFAFECQRQCLPHEALCFAGSFGSGSCASVAGCFHDCLEEDYACQRACFAAGSEANVQYFLDYEYCGLSQCYNSADPLAEENCLVQVASQPLCSDPYNQCFGTTGAGPGPGDGGSR